MSEKEVAEDYKTALDDLNNNSKPLITMLTMLAEENKHFATAIVQEVVNHINSTTFKLPAMYLIDSIVKNVGGEYKRLFGINIAAVFSGVFTKDLILDQSIWMLGQNRMMYRMDEGDNPRIISLANQVDEVTRKKLYELRQTWNEVFPTSRLYMLDFKIHEVDPAWPMTSQPKIGTQTGTNIYVNPNKFSPQALKTTVSASPVAGKVHPVASSSQDLKELKKLQNEKRALAETRQKVEKILMKEKEKDKTTTENLEKISPLEPKPNLNPNRQAFLRNFKIKKISPATADNTNSIDIDKKIMPNIYVAPWKAKEIMPTMVGGAPSPSLPKDSRIVTGLTRDSRMSSSNKVPIKTVIKEPIRDPRLLSRREPHSKNIGPSRDTHSKNNILSREDQYSPKDQLPATFRDPRMSGKSLVSAGISAQHNSSLKPSVSTPENKKANSSVADIRKASGCSIEAKVSGVCSYDLKKKSGSSMEVKPDRENHKKIKERDISSKHSKRDSDHKTIDSPHRKDKKDLDEKILREKDFKDKDERDNKDKDERDKRDKDERDNKDKDERVKRDRDERDNKDKDERSKRDRDERDNKDKDERSKKDRDERLKKDKDDKDSKDAVERDKKDKEERIKKEKEERFKKEKDEKIKKEKDDRDRKDSDEKEKKDKIEKDKREKDERDKKIKDEWDKKFKEEKDKKDLDDKTKKDKDEREKYEKIKKDKEDKAKKDKEKSTFKELESIKDIQHNEQDELDSIRVDIELRIKEEQEEIQREKVKKEERRKTEQLLKERYEQEITDQENERKMKEEEKRAEEKKKQEIETKMNEEKSIRKKKEASTKKSLSNKDKHKDKDKSSSETIENEEISSTSSNQNKSIGRQHSKKTSLQNKFLSPTKSDQSSLISEDKFKAHSNSSNRRREHIRPRDKTPELEANTSNLCLDSTNAVSSSVGGLNISESQNLIRKKEDTESDDSDHYDANKPRPSIFAPNKVKTEEVSSCILKTETFIDSSDTDLRSFTSQKNSNSVSNDATKEQASNQLGDLFGTSDTDLRQLPPPPPPLHFPLSQTTSTGVPPGVIVVNSFLVKPDQDLRENRMPSVAREELEVKDPRFSRIMDDKESFLNAGTSEDNEEMMGSKKHCFSSPHAAKWEKFREKNPEFKEYQRQASLSEIFLGKDDPNFPPSHDRPPSRSGGRGLGRRTRGTEGRQFNFSSPDQDWCIENSDFKSEENYQFMIGQLNEQFKNGEIPDIAYMRMMEGIRLRMEKDKIRELQEKERGDGPSRERWTPELERVGKGSHDRPIRPFEDKTMVPDSNRFNAGKWQPFNRGRGRGGPMPHGSGQSGFDPKMEEEWTGEADLPTLSVDILRAVGRESETRSINIDGLPRVIRTYGEKAIALDEGNDPRTVEFESVMCNIVFDEGKFSLNMNTKDNYRNFQIDGENHRIRLGVPTQELMIDGKSYQCYFGGKPISVYLAGKDRVIRLDGKPPQVVFGVTKNMDYLVGKVELIIDAKKIVHLFLDAKPQRFNIDGIPFVLKFIDSFKAVTINGIKFPVIFGGLPISISVRGYRRFLRFSALPPGVIPGKTSVKGMDSDGSTLIPSYSSSPPPNRDGLPTFSPAFNVSSDQVPSLRPNNCNQMPSFPAPTGVPFNQAPPPVPPLIPPPFPMLMKPPQIPIQIPPQILRMSHPPPVSGGVIPGSYLTTPAPQQHQSITSTSVPPPSIAGAGFPMPNVTTPAVPFVDVQSLLSNLLKTGLIGSKKKEEFKETKEKKRRDEKTKQDKEAEEEEIIDDLKDLPSIETMFNLDNLRKPNAKLITKMYRGMQCSSCGLRYPPDQTAQYSHHLDWHFRMNKKQQESTKKVNTRKFYLCIDDWLQYEEIEDIEERVPSMFEMDGETDSKSSVDKDEDEEEEIPSVSASSSDPCLGVCPICHETFDQFYHHNTEEWHYKYAIQVDGINYHPVCHQDLLKAQKNKEEKIRLEEEEKAKNLKIKEEELERLQKEEESERLHKEEELEKLHKEEELERLNKEEKIEKLKEKENDLEIQDKKDEENNSHKTEEVEVSEIESLDDESDAIKEIAFTVKKVDIPEINVEEEKTSDESIDDSATLTKTDTPKKRHLNDSVIDKTNNAAYNGFGNIKIKDEPMDTDDGLRVEILPRVPTLLADIPIKVELPDDDGFYEGDAPQTFEVEDEDEARDDNDDQDNTIANDSWTAQTSSADIAISIDGNTEIISQPEATQSTNSIPKIKISVSKPSLINNNVEHLENDKNSSQVDDIKKIPSFLEEFDDEFIPPPFTFDLKVKPAFEGVELINLPVEQRGLEISSLCSIM